MTLLRTSCIKCASGFSPNWITPLYFTSRYKFFCGLKGACMNHCVFVCVHVYPEIQFCAGSSRLCLFQAPHPALCAGRCGRDDQHIDVGRREHCVRQEGARRTPSWALRHTMSHRQRRRRWKWREERREWERGRRKLRKRQARQINKGKDGVEEIAEEREQKQQNRDRQKTEIIGGNRRKRKKDGTRSHRDQRQSGRRICSNSTICGSDR